MALRISRRSKTPPAHDTIVVPSGDEGLPFDELRNYWKFGPGTRHPWPSGDFYDSIGGFSESAWFLDELLSHFKDVVVYDPDLLMDKGL